MPDFHTLISEFLAEVSTVFNYLPPCAIPPFRNANRERSLAFRCFTMFGAIKTAKQIFQERPISSAAAKIVDLVMLCKLLFFDRYQQHTGFFSAHFHSFFHFICFIFFTFFFCSRQRECKRKNRTKMDEFSTQTVIRAREKKTLWFLWHCFFFPSFFIFSSICYLENRHHYCTPNAMDINAGNLSSENQRPRTHSYFNKWKSGITFGTVWVFMLALALLLLRSFLPILAQNFFTENDTEFNFMIALCVIIMKIHLATFARDSGSIRLFSFIMHVFSIIQRDLNWKSFYLFCRFFWEWIDRGRRQNTRKSFDTKYHTPKINKITTVYAIFKWIQKDSSYTRPCK